MHAAAAAGQLHIMKVLIKKYKVPPDSKDTVRSMSHALIKYHSQLN